MRERANSADLIVSHYLAARRRTPYSGETAASNFRALADDLRLPPPVSASASTAAAAGATSEAPLDLADEVAGEDDFIEPPPPVPAARPPRRREPPRVSAPPPAAIEPETKVGHARGTIEAEVGLNGLVWTVDQRSRTIAREVQDRMNLSSESEALRMLVAMGAERLRSVLS